ncbi:hypothetical protein KL86APRO_12036 [uncultured Alphaproteobacteria bacterium]|uniref:Superinfection immunity protein n=1 Tax=uncultured Alphaproteobacteria bacterium TaxID=91750 RepID=A0A212K292_9PROT|nr:hypothetical protein KL86APRO_12036 [uncultured Alphaproteobacteria bacterium]
MQEHAFLALILAAYFLPALIGYARHHLNAHAIAVLNITLGWTALGWIAALVWAMTNAKKRKRGELCSRCGGRVESFAEVCPHCGATFTE